MKDPAKIGNPRKIGIYIGVPGLGDLLFIIPLFRAFKKKFPDAETVFIGRLLHSYVKPVFDNCPYIDRLIDFHLYEKKSAAAYASFVRRLRRERFDLIVDTQRKFLPSLLLSLSGAKFMISYSSGGIFSDFPVNTENRTGRHTSDVSLDLARAACIENPETHLEISTGEENRRYAEEFYSGAGVSPSDILVGFIPGAGVHTRQWNGGKFAALADRLANELHCRLIAFGSLKDKPAIDDVISRSGAPFIIEDFGRKSILDSAALMARCNAIVGVDSGPLHVADAAGAPCVGIYGPTLPDRFGLLGKRTIEVCRHEDCAPCSDMNCSHRKCLEDITVDEVFDAVKKILE